MRAQIGFICVASGAIFLAGCTGGAASAIKAYATTAEEHAQIMKLNFDMCLKAKDPAEKDAVCAAVRSSIEAYRQSAANLKTIRVSN